VLAIPHFDARETRLRAMLCEHRHDVPVAIPVRGVVVARSELGRMAKRLDAPVDPGELDPKLDSGGALLKAEERLSRTVHSILQAKCSFCL
jgi:hypothetical protein